MQKEVWKPVRNYEASYEVSDLGNVRSINRWVKNNLAGKLWLESQPMSQLVSKKGYKSVILSKNSKQNRVSVHVLVAQSFLNYTYTGHIVCDHINEDKTDNRVVNLQVISNRKNVIKSMLKHNKYVGASFDKRCNKWYSRIYINGKVHWLGHFTSQELASQAYFNRLNKVK